MSIYYSKKNANISKLNIKAEMSVQLHVHLVPSHGAHVASVFCFPHGLSPVDELDVKPHL